MRAMFLVFAKGLFGVKMERVPRTLLAWLLAFWGIHLAQIQIQIAPFILYLMTGSVTAGVMWQALSSDTYVETMQNMLMMPFREKYFIFSYVSALGIYTFLTKTMGIMAIALAVCSWKGTELLGSILCTVSAILMTAFAYAAKKHRGMCAVWGGGVIAAAFLLWDSVFFLPVMAGNVLLAGMLLSGVDAYAFCFGTSSRKRCARSGKHVLIGRYLFRYLAAHKNYLANTAAMWMVACVLSVFLGKVEGVLVMPIGFAVLSLNTPICILLSCDPDLEQAVRFLPGQKTAFCVPYGLFIFLCNMTADLIFIGSWYLFNGGFLINGVQGTGGYVMITGVFFAMQSAVGSVLLEWFYPVRGWKIESDLWHHPRKYIVPVAMLLLAGVVWTIPKMAPVLLAALAVEVVVLLFLCRRC